MEIKLEKRKIKEIIFDDLQNGDIFNLDGEIYMKIASSESNCDNILLLSDGYTDYIHGSAVIQAVYDATITLRERIID